MSKLDAFTLGYLECAIWSSSDLGGLTMDDIHGGTLARMKLDCESFQKGHATLLERYCDAGRSMGHAGHDFWLTRNYHGCGFWSRHEMPKELGRALTDASHAYGEFYLYMGVDNVIYGSEG